MLRRFIALAVTTVVVGLLLFFHASSPVTVEQSVFAHNESDTGRLSPALADVQESSAEIAQVTSGRASGGANTVSQTKSEMIAPFLANALQAGVESLSDERSYDDFPSLAQTSDGTIYVSCVAFSKGYDHIRVRRRIDEGRWSTPIDVPTAEVEADVWLPQLAVDSKDRVWVIWSEQTGQTAAKAGNWDLYARALTGDRWGDLVRLTDNLKPDINPHVAVDRDRNIHVVWQAHPENNGDIQYCKYDGSQWSKPLAVTSDGESDWYPRVAVDKEGTAWIAFDSYRNGDYDVFLTSVRGNTLQKVIPVADSSYYEAHASVACTPDGKVWLVWEQGGHNWGKDRGYWVQRQNRPQGAWLGSAREVKVACLSDGQLLAAPSVRDLSRDKMAWQSSGMAELAVSARGDLWLTFRHSADAKPRERDQDFRKCTQMLTHLTKDGWSPLVEQPCSIGRVSLFNRFFPERDGSMWLAYSSDVRNQANVHQPVHDLVFATHIRQPSTPPGIPKLAPYEPPVSSVSAVRWNAEREARQVAEVRDYRAMLDGKSHRIVRGDLHRHTEMSWDMGPGDDGSYLDFYRYMIDVAALDFGCLTDHAGGGYRYWLWLAGKSVDMYDLAPRFVPLFGYERSETFPNGHRNVIHALRGVLPFDMQRAAAGTSGPGRAEDDTKQLYASLRRSGGLAISHTSGTRTMGTDWRDNDPEIEPVVEIYQGAGHSYETPGAPRVRAPDEEQQTSFGGYLEAGHVWKAYEKGYRLGTISSSDHRSTHISYAMVYTPENDRQSILDAIRKRHTYGATDNLIVDLRANGHLMGDEFRTRDKPALTLHVKGTAPIAQIDLIRNQKYIYTSKPLKDVFSIEYTDSEPDSGVNLYYFRILQNDGEVAWSSPVWIHFES